MGESVLRMVKGLFVEVSWRYLPRLAARESLVEECQEGWWALKSPRMSESSWVSKRESRSRWKSGGQEVAGGMYILWTVRGLEETSILMAECSVVLSFVRDCCGRIV